MTARPPAVAGQFYEGNPDRLREQVESAFDHRLGPGALPTPEPGPPDIAGLVSPHAGIPYSGPVAAHGYGVLAERGRPDVLLVVGPNHTGAGESVAVSEADRWETPLGAVTVHEPIRDRLIEASEHATLDEIAHRREHSIEVQLPFVQTIYDDPPAIVPVVMGRQTKALANDLGNAIVTAADGPESVLPIASTDLTHYEPQSVAESVDATVIERIEKLDAEGLMEVVQRDAISMCGHGPTAAVLSAGATRGADAGRCLQYATSGDVTGSEAEVVGYCSAVLE